MAVQEIALRTRVLPKSTFESVEILRRANGCDNKSKIEAEARNMPYHQNPERHAAVTQPPSYLDPFPSQLFSDEQILTKSGNSYSLL